MRENNCFECLKNDLNSLYSLLGKNTYLKDDLMYIEKSYKTIEKIWKEQYDKIKAINYIMISEAPLFGEKQSYFQTGCLLLLRLHLLWYEDHILPLYHSHSLKIF